MISVRNHKRTAAAQITLNENDRRQRLTLVNAFQILIDVALLRRKERQVACSQDILGYVISGLNRAPS